MNRIKGVLVIAGIIIAIIVALIVVILIVNAVINLAIQGTDDIMSGNYMLGITKLIVIAFAIGFLFYNKL